MDDPQGPGRAGPLRHAARFPKRLAAFEDPRWAIQATVLGGHPDGERFITPDTRFVTLGSCFADNLAQRLTRAGYHAHSELLGEEVNSPTANRHLLEWIEHGAVSPQTEVMQAACGDGIRGRYRAALADCDAFVFTLGVAPAFFDAASGDFAFARGAKQPLTEFLAGVVARPTSVMENIEHLKAIIAAVKRLSPKDPHIVLTVSPVPLAVSLHAPSAVIADCVSKSTLRVACEEVLGALASPRLHYWPSFEIVRWLAPYYDRAGPPAFGMEDGKTRHVSRWLIDLVVELFVQTYAVEAPR